jgi:hypothetical protein
MTEDTRLLRVIAAARLDLLHGTYAFEETGDVPSPHRLRESLACVRDGDRWSCLRADADGAYVVFAFHFPEGIDNSGFIGWLATLLKHRAGTGAVVICGSNGNDGGVFDYWAIPVAAAEKARLLVDELRAHEHPRMAFIR